MQTWEADSIGQKLATSFPRSSISAQSWAEELADLEKIRAEEACRRLIRTAEHPPTIAAFMNLYGSLAGTAQDTGPLCPDCDGTGLVTDRRHPQHWPGTPDSVPRPLNTELYQPGECACNVVAACSCKVGQAHGAHVIATINAGRRPRVAA